MIISEQWLRDWIGVDFNTKQIADCLTNAGLEVDGVESLPGQIENLFVGKVLSVVKHPDADRLNLTKVDIGSEQLEIVCGASNVHQDMLVAVATVGAKLVNGLKIKKAKVRGVESNGMLCSASELGLEENSAGLIELDSDAEIGQRVDEYLQLDDNLIDIDLTPNRGDCLSVQGIARELKVLADGDYHPLDIADVESESNEKFTIDVEDSTACPSYHCRVISGINSDLMTPLWLRERLRRSGVRPISPIVDITNYVMIELGQPMHAFDQAKLNNKIIVRQSREGESIKLLDESTATLDGDTLVIADTKGVIAIAGVMGGADSAIDDATTDIVLEAAHFTRKAVAGRSRRYGLHTESSHRFERGVDPLLPNTAMQRATELVLEICGGSAGPVNQQENKTGISSKPEVGIRLQRLEQLLGMPLEKKEVGDILKRIADSVSETKEGWSVSPPSYRFDIENEADLVEEVARVKGYDNIPTAIPRIAPRSVVASESSINIRNVSQTLIARDFNEAITYSFISPERHKQFSQEEPVSLSNPLAENMSVMRTSLLPGLLKALQFNNNRQHSRIRLFEIGASYHLSENGFSEIQRLAGVVTGPLQATQWAIPNQKNVDFYDIKADVEAILGLTGQKEPFIFNEFENISLHPGQQCSVLKKTSESDGFAEIGYIGKLHPNLQKELGVATDVFVFELDINKAMEAELPVYQQVSKFPSIKRDMSVVVKSDITVSNLLTTVENKLGGALNKVIVFDVYRGDGVAEGYMSVSFSLILQQNEKTMTDDEAEKLMKLALDSLVQKFAAELRS